MNDQQFDKLLDEIRNEEVSSEQLDAARQRVWDKLSNSGPCYEFRSQFEDYRSGKLAGQRIMLLEDHLTRCPDCRRALNQPDTGKVVAMPMRPAARRFGAPRWIMAAGIILGSLYAGRDQLDSMLAPGGPRATVEAVMGNLYTNNGNLLAAGATLNEAQAVRTAGGARATLRLADGSTVEVNESSELFVKAAWSGQSIHLERGDVIVQAAKQRRGHLRVITRDSVASVKGTVFTVSTGSAGSYVGVVEGSVAVDQQGSERLLNPGEKANTSAALDQISVREAVAWSPNAEKYYTLLAELAGIEKKLPALPSRTEARLLSALPANTVIYGALPNLGQTLDQAVRLIEQRSGESAVLKEWWSSSMGVDMKDLVFRINTVSPLLGNEIVFVMLQGAGSDRMPLLLAEVKNGQQAAVAQAIAKLVAGSHPLPYRFAGNLLAASDTDAHLATAASQLGKGAGGFSIEIARHYQRGVSCLLAVDLRALSAAVPKAKELEVAGVGQMRYLVVEQRNPTTGEENEASLAFNGPRTGPASWLATPSAQGSAEYVSSDAVIAFSAVTRNPRQIVDEFVAMMGRLDPRFATELANAESKVGVQLSTDLATALGTDFTLAVETPSIPIPGWFAAIEIYRPELFNASVRHIVNAFNREKGNSGMQLKLTEETVNGRDWSTAQLVGQPLALHWTVDRGYLVQSFDRAVVLRAISTRNGGSPLMRSTKFLTQLPTAAGLHQSGFLWVNLGGTLEGFAGLAPNDALKKLLAAREPALLTFSAETERISAASRTRLSSLFFDMLLVTQPVVMQAGKDSHQQLKERNLKAW